MSALASAGIGAAATAGVLGLIWLFKKWKNKGQVTIHIEGKYGAEALTPENYDITLMQSVLEYAIALLDLDKRKETPITTFHIESGSVNNVCFSFSRQ